MRDQPWVMRTYAGHSSAAESNALYRRNLGKGQTGLSVAFDLPTQTGYDPDSPLARGEVGKVGVPVPHLGEKQDLLAPLLPGMEQPPHPMRLGENEQDYYVQGPTLARRSDVADPVGEQVR